MFFSEHFLSFKSNRNPLVAWEFTKARQRKDGRTIPKSVFIECYFNAKENVNCIKSEFGNKVKVDLIIKDFEHKVEKIKFNIDKIDSFLKNEYNSESLEKLLK